MICTRPNCTAKEVYSSRLCLRHYQKALAVRPDQFNIWIDDIQPVIDRIQNFRDNRLSFEKMKEMTGVCHTVLASIHRGAQKRCRKNTYDAVLAVPPFPSVAVTPQGFRRRIRALAWMGWGGPEVAQEMGVSVGTVRDAATMGKFSPELGEKLREVYNRLSLIEGPNRRAQAFAKGVRAYEPPAAWDDDTIDTAPELEAGTYLNQPVKFKDKPLKTTKGNLCKSGRHRMTGKNVGINSNGRYCKACRSKRDKSRRKRNINPGYKCPYGHSLTKVDGEFRCKTCIRSAGKVV